MRITVIPSDGVRAVVILENDELGDAPYVSADRTAPSRSNSAMTST